MISKKLFGTLSDGREVDISSSRTQTASVRPSLHTAQPGSRFLRPTETEISRMFSSASTISRVMSSVRTIRVRSSADMRTVFAADILPLTAKKLML